MCVANIVHSLVITRQQIKLVQTMSVKLPFVKIRLFSTWAADIFWFRAFNRQAKAIPIAGIFLANVFRTFLEVATLVQATVTAILCRIGAFSFISSSTNFSHEKLESCSTVFCRSIDCVLGLHRFSHSSSRLLINSSKTNFFISGSCISAAATSSSDPSAMAFTMDFLFSFTEYGVIPFTLYTTIWHEKP